MFSSQPSYYRFLSYKVLAQFNMKGKNRSPSIKKDPFENLKICRAIIDKFLVSFFVLFFCERFTSIIPKGFFQNSM